MQGPGTPIRAGVSGPGAVATRLHWGDRAAQLYGAREWTYLSAPLDAAGSMHATFDLDGNGKRDALVDEVRAGGLLQSRTATQFDDSNDTVTRRETMTVCMRLLLRVR